MKIKVLLWDIDGTLIRSGGAGERAWLEALRALYGIDAGMHGIAWAGRTDPYISRLFFEKYGLPADESAVDAFLQRYVDFLPPELERGGGMVLPGVRQILEWVAAHPELNQGLLTGNVARGAEHKLRFFGIWDFFEVGAFADGFFDRPSIARHALAEVKRHWGADIQPREILVLGDTRFDVECGRAIGARTLGVGTGYTEWEELEASQPDFLLRDLSDGPAALEGLMKAGG